MLVGVLFGDHGNTRDTYAARYTRQVRRRGRSSIPSPFSSHGGRGVGLSGDDVMLGRNIFERAGSAIVSAPRAATHLVASGVRGVSSGVADVGRATGGVGMNVVRGVTGKTADLVTGTVHAGANLFRMPGHFVAESARGIGGSVFSTTRSVVKDLAPALVAAGSAYLGIPPAGMLPSGGMSPQAPAFPEPVPQDKHLLLYGGAGLGVLVLGVGLILIMRKK